MHVSVKSVKRTDIDHKEINLTPRFPIPRDESWRGRIYVCVFVHSDFCFGRLPFLPHHVSCAIEILTFDNAPV